jgi:hypothetical protein
MNYTCEIIEDGKNLIKIDHLYVHPINLRINTYLFQNSQLTVVSTNNFLIFHIYQLTTTFS